MGVVKEARTEYKGSAVTTPSFSHTHPTVSDDLLVVVIHGMRFQPGNVPFTVSAVTYNGSALAQLVSRQGYTTNRNFTVAIWYTTTPATGANTVAVTLSTDVSRVVMQAISFSGVDQTTPMTSISSGQANTTGLGGTATVDAGSDIWFSVLARGDYAGTTPGSGNTEEYESLESTGGGNTDARCSSVWRNFPSGGSSTLTISAGPTGDEGATWAFWSVNALVADDVLVAPDAVSAATAAVAPTIILGSLALSPEAASGSAVAVAPTIINVVTLQPDASTAATANAGPTVELGSTSTVPSAASAASAASGPTLVLSSTSVEPDAGTAATGNAGPTVVLGATSVTPDAASAASGATGPTIELGSTSVEPGAATAASGGSVTVLVPSEVITPDAASAASAASGPTLVLSSMTVTPSAASAASTALLGDVFVLTAAVLLTVAARPLTLSVKARVTALSLAIRNLDLTLRGK